MFYNSSSVTVDAENNWWDDAGGPGFNGDDVYGNVDTEPWLSAESDCVTAPPTNSPPFVPSDPNPAANAVDVDTADGTVALSWTGGDPNPWDAVVYDLYWGTAAGGLTLTAEGLAGPGDTLSGLAVGTTYYWQVVARDNEGAQTPGPEWSFTTRGPPPDLAVRQVDIDPAADIAPGQTVTFTATVENIGQGPAVNAFQVAFTIGGQSNGSQSMDQILAPGASIAVIQTWTARAGTHTLEVTADSSGQVSEENEENNTLAVGLPEILDTTPPALTETSPAAGSVSAAVLQISVTLTDAHGAVEDAAVIAGFSVTRNGQPMAGTIGEESDTFTFLPDAAPLPDGDYQVFLTAVDDSGNTQGYDFTFTVDLTPPPAPVVDAVTSPTHNPSQTVSGTKEAYAAILVNGTETIGHTPETVWQYAAGLVSGGNVFTFAAVDRAGNQGGATAVEIVYDDVPPEPVNTLALDCAGDGTTVVLDWSGYDETVHGDIAAYRIYMAASAFADVSGLTAADGVGAGTFSYTAGGLARGSVCWFAVVAEDVMGNVNPQVTAVSGTPLDIVAPEDVTGLGVNSYQDRLVFTWQPSADSQGDLAGYKVYFNGATQGTVLAADQTSREESGLGGSGAYPFRITAFDNDENESGGTALTGHTWLDNPAGLGAQPYSGYVDLAWNDVQPSQYRKHFSVYVSETDFSSVEAMVPALTATGTTAKVAGLADNTTYYFAVTTVNLSDGEPPAVTTLAAMPVPDQQGPEITDVQVDGTPLISGHTLAHGAMFSLTASDPAGVSRVAFFIDGVLLRTDYTAPYTAYYEIVDAADGDHVLGITAFDTLGNETSETFNLVVALDVPDAPVISLPANGTLTNRPLVTVSGTAEKYVQVALFVNGADAGASGDADGAGNFSISLTLVEGTNSIQAKAGNRIGTSPLSAAVAVTLDTAIPEPPTALTARSGEGGLIRLTWQRPVEGTIAGYRLYRAQTSFSTTAEAECIDDSISGTALDNLPPTDGTYYYRVATVSSAGNDSALSGEASAVSDSTMPLAVDIAYTPHGHFDPATGRMAPGMVDVVLTVSEPLMAVPFLSVTPEGGAPLSVGLTQADDVTYSGFFVIAENTPSGTAYAVFSARDQVGNRGTQIDAGESLVFDTDGPEVVRLTVAPQDPMQNDPQVPVDVTATLGLTEAVAPGTQPALSYLLSGTGREQTPVADIVEIAAAPGGSPGLAGGFHAAGRRGPNRSRIPCLCLFGL